ncbi:MAG: hypothetical protein M3Z48_06015 [Lactobacillus sp.]|uniref:hypothetical protein n=1 Tax=Lactobacillus TaxID=1578 RepID=UPI000EFAE4BC|nr:MULTISPECIES: hypothetical protein [Lactobacillus]MCT6891226.1 hypothetical protein [Lactobacillus sp.]MCT6902771.1 hypothetical protein [Lactobacillus sp.]RMC52134.1 hypothetical protein F5ESL0262_08805 [Lactobacillus sp. ESL0262]
MKHLITLLSSTAVCVSMLAVPATTVSATTITPAQSTATSNQLTKAETETLNAAIKGSLITYPDSSGVAQVKIVDKDYLAQSLKRTNLKVTVEDVQSALDKVNEYAKNHPDEFTYENPLLRKVRHHKACSWTMAGAGTATSLGWAIGSVAAGATGIGAALVGVGLGAIWTGAGLAC